MGSKFCSHCGSEYERAEESGETPERCPRCRVTMQFVAVGSARLSECVECAGVWAGVSAFEKICADREQQAAVLGTASPEPASSVDVLKQGKVRYVPCPICKQLMNRINFARCSGVIVDICKGHGTWFDHDELRQIVEFIRKGGLDAARSREKAHLEEERRMLAQQQLAVSMGRPLALFDDGETHASAMGAARGLLKLLID